MPIRKPWDHAIDIKEGFVLKKGKVYPLSRKEIEEVCEFISEQLRKRYIRPSKSSQMVPVFFVGKNDGQKSVWYRTIDILMNELLRITTFCPLSWTLSKT